MEERIKTKLKEIAKQKEQLIAQLNALMGAEQTLSSLLEDDDDDKPHD